MRVYIHGREGTGWSIDHDRAHLIKVLSELGNSITNNALAADVVHSVWWDQLLAKRNYWLQFKKKIIATASNSITPENPSYHRAKKFVTLWIAPSQRQLNQFNRDGVRAVYQPFFVDDTIFKPSNKSREELANALGINTNSIKDKFLIGSFQRDTLGSDLTSPKWQKGPELLIEILSGLPDKDKWLLVLTGPRRHYVVAECERRGIPYLFYGDKPVPGVDDISTAIQGLDTMALLYNLIDCYLVTSASEGGPKAVLEASFCKTMIFSTDVGFAPDFLDGRCIYNDTSHVASSLEQFISHEHQDYYEELVSINYNNVRDVCSCEAVKERWQKIYGSI